MRKTLETALQTGQLCLTSAQLDALCHFGQLLLEKNQVMNLTAITQPEAVAQLHFLDSLKLLDIANFSGKKVIDIGCGAGFPGIPLLIMQPDMALTLLDSTAKRIHWLAQEVLPALYLQAQCVNARAEEYVANHRQTFDFAVSRAVARLPVLAELALPYVRQDGYFLAMKGAAAQQEAEEAAHALRTLGGQIEDIIEYPIADALHRVIVIRKARTTPPRYPRRYAQIRQSPL